MSGHCIPCQNGLHHLCTRGACACWDRYNERFDKGVLKTAADGFPPLSEAALAKLARELWPGRAKPGRN